MDEDFFKLSKMFNAMRSVVRVPARDPKYKIAVLASKQVCFGISLITLLHGWILKLAFCCYCRNIALLICYTDCRKVDFLLK